MSSLSPYRIAAAVPKVKPGNITENTREIIQCCQEAAEKGVSLLLFPELSLTGAYCGDLFGSSRFKKEVSEALKELQDFSAACQSGFIAGFPLYARGALFNCAAFFHKGRIHGISCKYAVNDSLFTSGTLLEGETLTINGQDLFCTARQIYESDELRFAIIIGDDLLLPGNPVSSLAPRGAQVILNPAAPPELAAVSQERREALKVLSRTITAAVVTSGAGPGEPGSDFICGGRAAIFNNGRCDAENTPLPRERDLIFADIIPERLDQRRIRKNISNPFIREEVVF